DTLGKVMPPARPGESAYQRDYRIGSTLKRLVDECPGSSIVVNHHDRKAGSDDFVDSVSGTHGLGGAADTILVLSRERHSCDGTFKVTGRDVVEDEYALRLDDGTFWVLSGGSPTEAARLAVRQRASEGLADRSQEVLAFVNDHQGVTPRQ